MPGVSAAVAVVSGRQVIAPGSCIVIPSAELPDDPEERTVLFGELANEYGKQFIIIVTPSGHVDTLDDEGILSLVETRLLRDIEPEVVDAFLTDLRGLLQHG